MINIFYKNCSQVSHDILNENNKLGQDMDICVVSSRNK